MPEAKQTQYAQTRYLSKECLLKIKSHQENYIYLVPSKKWGKEPQQVKKGEKFSKGLNGYLLHFEFKIDSDVRNQVFWLGVSLIGGQDFQDFLAGFYPRLPAHGGQDGVVEAEVGLSEGLGSKLEWKRPT